MDLQKSYGPNGEKLFLPATDANREVDRIQGIIKAQAGAIVELKEAIRRMVKNGK